MSYFKLKTKFKPSIDQSKAITQLVKSINNHDKYLTLLGTTGSGKTFTMANVIQNLNKPTLILSHNKTLAAQLYAEFKLLFPDNLVEYFISYYDYYQPEAYMPVTDTYIEKDASINDEIDKLRLKATASLVERRDVIIIASVSCIYGIGSVSNFRKFSVALKLGDEVNTRLLFDNLISIHYLRNDITLKPGTFRVRGDVIEIYLAYDEKIIRLELFGEIIERISFLNPITMKIISEENNINIYPAKHFVTSSEDIDSAIDSIQEELSLQVKRFKHNGQLIEAQRIEQRTNYDIEMIREMGYCSGIENYSRFFDGREKGIPPNTLLDFFDKDYIIFIDESHVMLPQIRAMYNGDKSRKESLIEHGFRLPSALDNRPLTFEEFNKKINQVIYVSATPSEYESTQSGGQVIEQIIRPTGLLDPEIKIYPSKGQIDIMIDSIKKVISRSERVLITTLTKRMAEDLSEYLKDKGIKSEYMHSEINSIDRIKIIRSLRLKEIDVLIGINLLREGLDLPEVSLVIVVDADKEGFLRSKTSLMQVAGRAARNINGNVILFADNITDSIQYLINETDRRRKLQIEFNKAHNIIPSTIKKSLEEVIESTLIADNLEQKIEKEKTKLDFTKLSKFELEEMANKVKNKMLNAAKKLQFEEAALLRDSLENIKNQLNL